jgi:glycosyltransferase involved in cell wall biosynthesis
VPLVELPSVRSAGVGVVVAPAAGREPLARALRSILRHTDASVPVLVAAGPEAEALLRELDEAGALDRDVALVAGDSAPAVWNRAEAALGRDDLVLVHPDAQVGSGWLVGLREAVHGDATLATATALSNHGAFASVPRRNLPWALLPSELEPEAAAALLRERSPRVHPRIPTALAHCALVQRAALDLAGPFDEAAPTPQAALDAFCQTATATGLRHVLADDVLVAHRGGAGDAAPARSPVLEAAVEDAADDRFNALGRAIWAAAAVLSEPTVTVDARCLGGGVSGSTVVVLELLAALHRAGRRPRVLLPDRPGELAERVLAGLHGIERLPASSVTEGVARTAIVHRPWQVDTGEDLRLLDQLGERLVISHHDLIAYRNPDTFPDARAWLDHRRVTQEALGLAAAALFLSEHVLEDALADDLLPRERAHVVPAGVDHRVTAPTDLEPRRPASTAPLGERPFLACVGSRLRHKNVLFALKLLAALHHRGWQGDLVIAGRDVPTGSSSGAEAAYLAARPGLARHVVELGAVDEAEKAWLYREAAAILYPSTVEGFGLIPFEAAAAGTPCLAAPVASLAEFLPVDATVLVPWDPELSAARVQPILEDEVEAVALVDQIEAAGERHTWDRHAALVIDAYNSALRLPAPPTARLGARLAEAEHAYWRQRDAIGAAGYALVDPDDPLLSPEEREALVAAARGRRTRPALLRAARALTRLRDRG